MDGRWATAMAEAATTRAPECRWWGWGDAGRPAGLPSSGLEMLRSELGEAPPTPRVERDAVRLPPARPVPPAIGAIVGPGRVLTTDDERLLRSAGKGYPDLVRARAGRPAGAPDAVVVAADAASVARLLDACSTEGVAVVPFGGGTSVVGGVDPVRGRARAADRPRPARASRRRHRPRLADRHPRSGAAGPRGRAPARSPRADAWALPAVVRVRDRRRLRRHPLGGSGVVAATGASTSWSRRWR